MEAAGYLTRVRRAGGVAGRFVWENRFTPSPRINAGDPTIDGKPVDGAAAKRDKTGRFAGQARADASSAPSAGLPAMADRSIESDGLIEKQKREKQRPLSLTASTPTQATPTAGAEGGAQKRGQGVVCDRNGVWYEVGNTRDDAALAQLAQLPDDLVQEAAATAAAADARGVAWPGSTLVVARRLAAEQRRRERDAEQLAQLRSPYATTSTTDGAGAGAAARQRLAALQARMRRGGGAKQ
jgi:hypothetical protein